MSEMNFHDDMAIISCSMAMQEFKKASDSMLKWGRCYVEQPAHSREGLLLMQAFNNRILELLEDTQQLRNDLESFAATIMEKATCHE